MAILIETHHLRKPPEWGVSLTSSNPPPEDYIGCADREEAEKLLEYVKGVEMKGEGAMSGEGFELKVKGATITGNLPDQYPEQTSEGFVAENVRDFTTSRDNTHGDAWKVTGQVMDFLAGKAPVIYMLPSYMILPWMNILMKVMRILWSPMKRDNWFDIMGYVDLVLREMDEGSRDPNK